MRVLYKKLNFHDFGLTRRHLNSSMLDAFHIQLVSGTTEKFFFYTFSVLRHAVGVLFN